MTYLKFFISITFIFFTWADSFAGVTGSPHDMYSQGKGTNLNVCSYCHIPHNAAGEKIWSDWGNEAQLSSGPSTTIGNMCYTCHDGTVTSRGLSKVFNVSLQQHKITPGEDCNMCHTVHDNTNGKFMNIAKYQNSYCAACHDTTVNAGGLGDHVGPGNHPNCGICHGEQELNLLGANGDGASCHLCHARAHGATNYSTPGVTNPILNGNNTDSQMCGICHFDLVQATVGGAKHPANMTTAGAYGKMICQTCHDPHQPGVTNHPLLLTDTNIDSQMCIDCHNGTRGSNIGFSHPSGIPFGATTPVDSSGPTGTPLGNVIDDYDAANPHEPGSDYVPDYPLNSASITCETCHSVHRKVDDAGTKLLRITNTNSALCLNCHAGM